MCTVSWAYAKQTAGYTLFFNRDEQRTRPLAAPLQTHTAPCGARYTAALDAQAGGTWLLSNQHGLSVGLLNAYQAHNTHGNAYTASGFQQPSRGHLVKALAGARSVAAAQNYLQELESSGQLPRYQGFTLFALGPGADTYCAQWNGQELTHTTLPLRGMLSSSSVQPGSILPYRAALFESMCMQPSANESAAEHAKATLHAHERFHTFYHTENPASGPRMQRADAQTVHTTRTQVTENGTTTHAWNTSKLSAANNIAWEAPEETALL